MTPRMKHILWRDLRLMILCAIVGGVHYVLEQRKDTSGPLFALVALAVIAVVSFGRVVYESWRANRDDGDG